MHSTSLRLLCAGLFVSTLASVSAAQARYDFNTLMGSDMHPYTPLDGQDGWSEETFNAANPCGVTATLSHDGTQSLRFQEVGPGYGCDASRIGDASWSFAAFTGAETSAYFQADVHVGFWGGSFGLAHDVSGNGRIRGSEVGERGVLFTIGTNANVQLRLVRADLTFEIADLGALGIGGGDWVQVRVLMDLAANAGAGSGSLLVRNITAGATTFTAVSGLQDVALALDTSATDASNPTLWDAVWLHFEGATYGLDNIEVGELRIGTSYCGPAIPNSSGLDARIIALGSGFAGDPIDMSVTQGPPTQFGYFLAGQTQGFFNPPGSSGFICLIGNIGRYNNSAFIFQFDAAGVSQALAGGGPVTLPTTSIPVNPPVPAMAGQTWNFQGWFRDNAPTLTSNFSDGIEITFL